MLKMPERCMSEQVVKSKDVRRQTKELQGVGGCCFTNCVRNGIEKAVSIMCSNLTRLKGEQKLQLNNIKVSSAMVGRYVINKGWKALKRKKAVHTSCKHGIRRVCKL